MISVADRSPAPSSVRTSASSRRLCVLDLRDTFEIGGPGKTIIETYRAIDRRCFDMHVGVFARHQDERSPFIDAARNAGLPVHRIVAGSPYDPRIIRQIVHLIDTLGVDIVHAHEVISDVMTLAAGRFRGVPTMTTLHGWIGNSFKQRALIALDRRVVRGLDAVVAVSQRMFDEIKDDGYRPRQLRLLHNAIVLDNYVRTGKRGYIASRIGRAVPSPVIVSIGRLSVEKGHADLVDAVAQVISSGHQCSLVLAGDGAERQSLEQRATRHGIRGLVHFTGYVEEPARILEDADLAVLPSHTEGLPNAALEALAMQVPLVATRVGGTPEVVTHGETGWLVPARDPAALSAAIVDALTRPEFAGTMVARGRRSVEERFDFRARTRSLEALYVELGRKRG